MVRNYNPIREVGQGTRTTHSFTLVDVNERPYEPIDLTNATRVRLTMVHKYNGETVVGGEPCTVPEGTAAEGYIEYTFSPAETRHYDTHYIQFEIEWANGETDLVPPSESDWTLFVGRRLPRDGPFRASSAVIDEVNIGTAEIGEASVDQADIRQLIASLDVGGNDITNVGTVQGNALNIESATITGLAAPLDAGGQPIDNVGDPPSTRGLVPQEYVDNMAGANITGASNPATANYNFNNYKGINLAAPTAPGDSARYDEIETLDAAKADKDGGGSAELTNYAAADFRDLLVGDDTVTGEWRSFAHISGNGPQAGLSAAQNPNAVYHEGTNTTYIVWRGVSADPYATAYDHATGEFAPKTQVGTNVLPDDDEHGMPALTIGPDDYLYCFFGGHSSVPPQIAKSDVPLETGSWTALGDFESLAGVGATYPSPLTYNGGVYALFRASPPSGEAHGSIYPAHEFGSILRTTDGGATWTDIGPIIDTTGHPDTHSDAYVYDFDVLGGEIHMSWTVAHGNQHNDKRSNAYHAVYDPATNVVRAMDGTEYAAPITWAQMETAAVKVYDGLNCNSTRHAISGDGEIYVSFNAFDSVDNVIKWYVGRWDSATLSWDVSQVANAVTNDNYDAGHLRTADDGHIQLFATTNDGSVSTGTTTTSAGLYRGGNITRYDRQPDGTWTTDEILAKEDSAPYAVGWNPPSVVRNGRDDFPALASEWARDKLTTGMRVLGVGKFYDVVKEDPESKVNTDTRSVTGDGVATRFYLGHGHEETPGSVSLTPRTAAAADKHWVSGKNGKQVRLDFTTAPANAAELEYDIGALGEGESFGGTVYEAFPWAKTEALADRYTGHLAAFELEDDYAFEGSHSVTGTSSANSQYILRSDVSVSRPVDLSWRVYIPSARSAKTYGGFMVMTGGTADAVDGYRMIVQSDGGLSMGCFEAGTRTSVKSNTTEYPVLPTDEWLWYHASFAASSIDFWLTDNENNQIGPRQTWTNSVHTTGGIGLSTYHTLTADYLATF